MTQSSVMSKHGAFAWQPSTAPSTTDTFPFVAEFSLQPLVTFWQQSLHGEAAAEGACAAQLHAALQQCPALLAPIADLAILAPHQAWLDRLMRVIIPQAAWEDVYTAALTPSRLQSFYATPSFSRLLLDEHGMIRGRSNVDEADRAYARTVHAYALLLKRIYHIDIDFDYPLIFTGTDPATGLDCHFKAQWNTRFLEVQTVGDIPPMTDALRRDIMTHRGHPEQLMRLLPPQHFVFHGFLVLNALEVTAQEELSSLKHHLIDRESLISRHRFHSLQGTLRTLFRQPDLCFSIAAREGAQLLLLHAETPLAYQCIYADSTHYAMAELDGSLYARAVLQGERVCIEDLTTYTPRSAIEETMLLHGVRNCVIAPLVYQDSIIGALILRSPRPGALHALNTVQLQEVLPLFAMAVQRSMDELNTRIQAVIKEQCTAIHPAVEWRFRQAAMHWGERRQRGTPVEMEPIVFEDVYPLYGVSDIRGSSTHRNTAIQADLIAHLECAREILQLGHVYRTLPLLTAMSFHVSTHIAHLETGLCAGDETTVLDFLRRDIEPVFAYLHTYGSEVGAKIDMYRSLLHPRLGTFYQQRRDFEDSVMQLNETLAAYLEGEEDKAQAMIPHYFEQHKSDGIEFGIYVGASLLEHGGFDRMHVHNLRLWQLLAMCGLAQQAAQVKAALKVPLDVAHLILVQDTPLAIRFRFDEKRFDIDGAYNMHYEIVKKRIDKAMVKDTDERLTQPGKIAIVYTQPREALEYRGYIAYLHATGALTDEVETLALEELQGAQGLQALRVTVALPPLSLLRPEETAESVPQPGK